MAQLAFKHKVTKTICVQVRPASASSQLQGCDVLGLLAVLMMHMVVVVPA